MAIAETKAGIEKAVALDEERVRCIGGIGSHEANPEVSPETGKAALALGIVGECADLVARRLRQPLANVRRRDVIDIVGGGERVATVQIQARKQTSHAFQFHTARPDFAVLVLIEVAIRNQNVSLVDLEDRCGHKAVGGARLDFDAAFDLTSVRRNRRSAREAGRSVVNEGPRVRQEARGVREVGRDTGAREIGDADSAGETLIEMRKARSARHEVGDVVFGEVLATSQGEDEVIAVLDLILRI